LERRRNLTGRGEHTPIDAPHPDELAAAEISLAAHESNGAGEVPGTRGVADLRQHLRLLREPRIDGVPYRVLDENDGAGRRSYHGAASDRRERERQAPAEAPRPPHRARSARTNPAPRMVWSSGAVPATSIFRRTRLTCTSTRLESPS